LNSARKNKEEKGRKGGGKKKVGVASFFQSFVCLFVALVLARGNKRGERRERGG